MVPIRLGLDNIQTIYLNQVKSIFKFEHNVGIAGGRDNEAYYLVGLDQENIEKAQIYYLDPHLVQRAVPS